MAVRIQFGSSASGDGWHSAKSDFAHATIVLVPSSGSKTVNVVIT